MISSLKSRSHTSSFSAVLATMSLINSRNRSKLLLLVAIQCSLSFLDLAGIALLSLVIIIGSSAVAGPTTSFQGLGPLSELVSRASESVSLTLWLAGLAAVILVFKSVLSFMLTRRTFRFLANRQTEISSALARKLLSQPLIFVQRRTTQDTASTLTRSVSMLTLGVLGQSVILISELTLLAVLVIALFFVDFAVAVFSIVIFGIVGLITQKLISNYARTLGIDSYNSDLESLITVQEVLRSYREVTVSGRRQGYIDKFETLRSQAAGVQIKLFMVNLMPKYVYEVAFVVAGVILVGTQLLTRDLLSAVIILGIFLAAGSRMIPSLLRIQAASITIRTAIGEGAPALLLNADLKKAPDFDQVYVQENVSRLESQIASKHFGFVPEVIVNDCSLHYPAADRPALLQVSFVLEPGTSSAIVGSTGAGKSTLADVILGVLTPSDGEVRLSGLPPMMAVNRWPGAIAYVPQEVTIMNGSIKQNVALGIPLIDINEERVWEALEDAQLTEVVQALSDGQSTIVGENGFRLSGGQRQRLGLARALYTRPRLLVLDEATSALDSETEFAVTQALTRNLDNRTQIIIAHRLATVRECDKVLFLQEGKLVAEGTFDEVRSAVPEFDRQANILGLA